jgi:hypothetical protein
VVAHTQVGGFPKNSELFLVALPVIWMPATITHLSDDLDNHLNNHGSWFLIF